MFLISQGIAQNIKVDTSGVYINSVLITNQSTPESVYSILGEPDLIHAQQNPVWSHKRDTTWIYNKLGLNFRFERRHKITSINIDFTKGKEEYSPTSTFSGELSLFEVKIDEKTTINKLRTIKELQCAGPLGKGGREVYFCTNSNNRFVFNYVNSESKLNRVFIVLRDRN